MALDYVILAWYVQDPIAPDGSPDWDPDSSGQSQGANGDTLPVFQVPATFIIENRPHIEYEGLDFRFPPLMHITDKNVS